MSGDVSRVVDPGSGCHPAGRKGDQVLRKSDPHPKRQRAGIYRLRDSGLGGEKGNQNHLHQTGSVHGKTHILKAFTTSFAMNA